MDYQEGNTLQSEPWAEQVSAGRPTLIKGIGGWSAETGVQPSVVRGARAWFIIQTVLSALMILPFALMTAAQAPGMHDNAAPMLIVLILNMAACATTVYLINRRDQAAWTWALVLAALSLTSIPIGMAVGIYILNSWFKPETKAWFGRY